MIVLSDEQQRAVELIGEWYTNPKHAQIKTLGGYAGTGKSTIIRAIIEVFQNFGATVAVCAFTGKAVSVLQRKGIPSAVTLHRLMYDPEVDEETKKVTFVRKEFLPCDVVVVDEASMVSRALLDDLLLFGKPVLAVGDHGQLEPVGDDPGLMLKPDITLETIHRQAEGSGILQFAHALRKGIPPSAAMERVVGEGVDLVRYSKATQRLEEFDQVICGFNKTRTLMNQNIRQRRGFKGTLNAGERLICLRNNREEGVFNGQMAMVEEVRSESYGTVYADLLMEDGTTKLYRVPISVDVLTEKEPVSSLPYQSSVLAFTYGYVTTCHKFQGSEADNVLVLEEIAPKLWDASRWRYTAATRAARRLVYAR